MSNQPTDWVLQLNNYCQKNGLSAALDRSMAGLQNAPSWTVKYLINGVELGRGTATTTQEAKVLAAEMALRALWHGRKPVVTRFASSAGPIIGNILTGLPVTTVQLSD
ncbi:hypothetical protein C8Q79DRAFT_924059 [Trametes meyenii]|nr:hypothetical protein C8Q79DRAFT_924059 [Trametes meyenii]